MSTHTLGPEEIARGISGEVSGEHTPDGFCLFHFGRKNIVGRPNADISYSNIH